MMAFSLIALIIGLFFVVMIIALVVLVIWAVRRTPSSAKNGSSSAAVYPQSPKEMLQMRYASGEITREQYQEMLRDLEAE